jgi:hypothetical protein
MSYKDKAVSSGSPDYRGGAITDQTPRKRYPCFAGGCPMPGSIFTGGTDSPGVCAWHYRVAPNDIPKVTQALRDWECVAYEVREARRVLTGEMATSPKAVEDAFAQAWERLEPLAGDYLELLKPGNIRQRTGRELPFRETYSDWAKRLTEFLGARVVEVQSVHRRAA